MIEVPTTYPNPSPQVRKIKTSFPGYLTTAEVARLIGRTRFTVQRWRLEGILLPSHQHTMGKIVVWLYDDATVREALALSRTLKPGRKPKPRKEDGSAYGYQTGSGRTGRTAARG